MYIIHIYVDVYLRFKFVKQIREFLAYNKIDPYLLCDFTIMIEQFLDLPGIFF